MVRYTIYTMEYTKYKTYLEQELQEVVSALRELGVQNPATPQDWIATPGEVADTVPDPNDFGDRSEQWQERRGTLSALETRFNNISRALEKIKNNRFGICELCGKQIEEERLQANPAARTCKADIDKECELPL